MIPHPAVVDRTNAPAEVFDAARASWEAREADDAAEDAAVDAAVGARYGPTCQQCGVPCGGHLTSCAAALAQPAPATNEAGQA